MVGNVDYDDGSKCHMCQAIGERTYKTGLSGNLCPMCFMAEYYKRMVVK